MAYCFSKRIICIMLAGCLSFSYAKEALSVSPGNVTYYVNPVKGDDTRAGTSKDVAWRSIAKINALRLAAGDQVVIAPGLHASSLTPSGEGSAEHPIVIRFLPGVHEFALEGAVRRPYYISNSSDDPKTPKPVTLLVEQVRHLRIEGGGVSGENRTTILSGGRMVEIVNDRAEDVSYANLVFDLKRPTVSELRVMEVGTNSAVLCIAEQSDYVIEGAKLRWTGDLGRGGLMVQEGIPDEGRCWRGGKKSFMQSDGLTAEKIEDLGSRQVRLTWAGTNHGLQKGHQFHFRLITRDSVGVHNTRSKAITFRDCEFNALTGMGFVSQFTDTITIERVNVIPPAGTIRTCPAWGDIFQFSNCRGEIRIESCRLSGMQDDAINCHGTHLRIIEKLSENQLLMCFMHGQTFGFAAFAPGDEVAVIGHATLRELPGNPRRHVTKVEQKNEREWILTLDGPAPAFGQNDVLDNITWYPDLTVRNVHVSMDPVRGFLLTTRGKVLIEGNTFHRPAMAGILIEDDAEGWFESGPVRDMTVRSNRFINCGIQISPQARNPKLEEPVHENIRIEDNFFDGGNISAKSVKGLTVINNRSTGGEVKVSTSACTDVTTSNNKLR